MKNNTFLLIFIIFFLLFSLSLTYTYFIKEEHTKSVITYGNIKLKLIEKTLKNGRYVDVNGNDSINITGTNKISRKVKAKNIGRNSFYLRLKVDFINLNNNQNLNDLIKFTVGENWEYRDGYYYYLKKVEPFEETKDLFNSIEFDHEKLTSYYQGEKFKLKIQAYAVQSENNSDNIFEVSGWPE